jgi:hypothetical protein
MSAATLSVAALLLAAVVSAASTDLPPRPSGTPYYDNRPPNATYSRLGVDARTAWTSNHTGAALQAAGLYYGVWVSQQAAQHVLGFPASETADFPLFDKTAAAAIRYHFQLEVATVGCQVSDEAFVLWVVAAIDAGHVVLARWYHKLAATALTPARVVQSVCVTTGYERTSAQNIVDLFLGTLDGGNARRAQPLTVTEQAWLAQPSLAAGPTAYALPSNANCGSAVTGVTDDDGEALRMMLTATEEAVPANFSAAGAAGSAGAAVSFAAEVYGLTATNRYAVLRFDDRATTPPSGFLGSNAWTKRVDFVANGSTHTIALLDQVLSHGTVFSYRCVLVRDNVPKTEGPHSDGGMIGRRFAASLPIWFAFVALIAAVIVASKKYKERKVREAEGAELKRQAQAVEFDDHYGGGGGAVEASGDYSELERPLTSERIQ